MNPNMQLTSVSQGPYTGTMSLSPSEVYAIFNAAHAFDKMGVTKDSMVKIGQSMVNEDGTLNLQKLVDVYNDLSFTEAVSRAQGIPYSAKEVVDELTTAPKSGAGRKVAAGAGIGLVGLLAAVSAGNAAPSFVGENQDNNIYAAWGYGNDLGVLTGGATLYIENIGQESRSKFEFKVADLQSLVQPSGWASSYNPSTDVVTLIGGLGNGGNITIPFTYNPTNKELQFGSLKYFGDLTSGTLENIAVVGDKVIPVPLPATGLLLGAGLAGIGLARRRLFKD